MAVSRADIKSRDRTVGAANFCRDNNPGIYIFFVVSLLLKRATFLLPFLLWLAGGPLSGGEVPDHEISQTPAFQEFVASYMAAVNARDIAKFTELAHPKCVKAVRKDNDWFKNRFEVAPIPAKPRIFVYAIDADSPLPFAAAASVAVRPTHKIQISWDLSPDEEAGEVCWVVMEEGKWREVIPEAR